MDAKPQSKIELTTSAEDWTTIRECYVKSFIRYPLYKYMVPDQSKREEFLRAYLDANYDVTVGSGQGILLAIKVLVGSGEEAYYKVVGGVVFVPPSSDGCGWAIGSDEPYWEAYEKHQLSKISAEGLERVKRYESWENEHIAQKASGTRIPLWNGLFCAIEPDYASKGVGSAVYKEAIRIMARFWVKQEMESNCNGEGQTKSVEKSEKPKPRNKSENGFFSKAFRNSSYSRFHHMSLLHHTSLPPPAIVQKKEIQQKDTPNPQFDPSKPMERRISIKDMMFNPKAPLVVAISHSERSSRFHQSNGFQPVTRIPFYDNVDDVIPFYTHILVLDPFCTGKFCQVEAALHSKDNLCEIDLPQLLAADLKPTNHILV